jgi:hypothetical protein
MNATTKISGPVVGPHVLLAEAQGELIQAWGLYDQVKREFDEARVFAENLPNSMTEAFSTFQRNIILHAALCSVILGFDAHPAKTDPDP